MRTPVPIYIYQAVLNDKTHASEMIRQVLAEDIPCRISFSNFPIATDGDRAEITQNIKLFLASDVKIPAGSYVTVQRQGIAVDYAFSSQPAIYATHQEVNLELYKEEA